MSKLTTKQLERALALAGKSKKDLRSEFNISYQGYHAWKERGVSEGMIIPISKYLGLSVEEMISGVRIIRGGRPAEIDAKLVEKALQDITAGLGKRKIQLSAVPLEKQASLIALFYNELSATGKIKQKHKEILLSLVG